MKARLCDLDGPAKQIAGDRRAIGGGEEVEELVEARQALLPVDRRLDARQTIVIVARDKAGGLVVDKRLRT